MRTYLAITLSLLAFVPLAALAAPDGETLFDAHCSTCHRKGGEGSIGLPLKKEKFNHMSDEYLTKTIRIGRPGRIMPTFPELSDSQVQAIVAYLREWSGIPSTVDQTYKARGDRAAGQEIFEAYCASCHGEEGTGLGKGTGQSYSRERDFKVIPPAIGNIGFLASASDGMLQSIITQGIKGTTMPAFDKSKLTDRDVQNTIAYLRSLQEGLENKGKQSVRLNSQPTIIVDSPHDYETTVANLKRALKGNNFRVFPDRYIEQGLFPNKQMNKKQITIRYCNFTDLYDMLLIDPRLGIGLPCRIAVIEDEKGKVKMIAMNMNLIAKLFNNAQLEGYAKEMSEKQRDILEEATF